MHHPSLLPLLLLHASCLEVRLLHLVGASPSPGLVGRAWAGRHGRARRAVRGGEGQRGEALAVFLVKADQALKFLLNVVHLYESLKQ